MSDAVEDEEEEESSLKESFDHKKHRRNQSSLIDNNFLDLHEKQDTLNEDDKHILISEKYSIDVDNTDSKPIKDKPVEESKESSYKSSVKGGKRNTSDVEDRCQDSDSVRRRSMQKEHAAYKSLLTSGDSKHKLFPIVPSDFKRHSSTENNNLDLKSVRSSSKYQQSEEQSPQILDICQEDRDKATLFSDLSKDFKDNQNVQLSNTLDVASLAKLRRMFGSERLIREYRTSEDNSHFNYGIPEYGEKLRSEGYDYNDYRPEIFKEDLIFEDDLHVPHIDYRKLPINLAFGKDDKEDKTEEFMATSDLINLFTSEGANKILEPVELQSDEKEHTLTLFEKNPFKDFTMTKIHEVLQEKDFDEMQEIRKTAIHHRASVEKKLLHKIHDKQSPSNVTTKKRDIEKWVDKELKEVDEDTDKERVRQKTIKTICETNVHTERIFDLLQRMNTTESNLSSHHNQEKVLEKNTIDELLKTDSDNSPFEEKLDVFSYHKHKLINDTSSISDNDKSIRKFAREESNKTEDDMDICETTQELMNKNFDQILRSRCGVTHLDTEESKEQPDKDLESVVTFQPKEIPDTISKTSELDDAHESDTEIITTEVNLIAPEDTEEAEESEKDELDDKVKVEIAENILGTLIREIQEFPFPLRNIPHEENKKVFESKYSEKAVFHIKPIQPNSSDHALETIEKARKQGSDENEISMENSEDEIMTNFNIIRTYEMKRSRAEKNQYDSKVFVSYINEVFSAIKSKAYLFLKAFSKPIQKDYLECLTKLHYHGLTEEFQEDMDNSMLNELDDQSSILTIDLYLSLEKKREEENDRIRKLEVEEIPDSKMPTGLLKSNRGKLNKTHIKNKLSLFAE